MKIVDFMLLKMHLHPILYNAFRYKHLEDVRNTHGYIRLML